MTDLSKLAASLTEAQRRALRDEAYYGPRGWRMVYSSRALAARGLVPGVSGPRLTDLGREVVAYLKGQSDD